MSATWSLDVATGYIYVGHTTDLDDAAAPIYTERVSTRRGFLDLTCPTCPGRPTVFRGGGEGNVGGPLDGHDFDAGPLVIIEHPSSCSTFAGYRAWWTREAGR